jgi:hypothetical protein
MSWDGLKCEIKSMPRFDIPGADGLVEMDGKTVISADGSDVAVQAIIICKANGPWGMIGTIEKLMVQMVTEKITMLMEFCKAHAIKTQAAERSAQATPIKSKPQALVSDQDQFDDAVSEHEWVEQRDSEHSTPEHSPRGDHVAPCNAEPGGSVRLEPCNAAPGGSVRLELDTPTRHSSHLAQRVQVAIDGHAFLEQQLQNVLAELASIRDGKQISPSSNMSARQVAATLNRLGMSHYLHKFETQKIDDDALPLLTDAHLKEMGLPIGHRVKLLQALGSSSARLDSGFRWMSMLVTISVVSVGMIVKIRASRTCNA